MNNNIGLLSKFGAVALLTATVGCAHVGSDEQAAFQEHEQESIPVAQVALADEAGKSSDASIEQTFDEASGTTSVQDSKAVAEADEDSAEKEKNVDPWEAWNRPVSNFNYVLDRYLLKPAAKGYRWAMPDFGERAVSRFFGNLGEISNFVNNFLQAEPVQGLNSAGRFIINSTLGVGGLIEVASPLGLPKEESEDFGQTLGVWGVGSGPYLVIPFLGPSTLRDTPSRVVDWQLDPINFEFVNDDTLQFALNAVDLVQTRASLLDSEGIISGDIYIFVRDAYLQRREFLVNDGKVDEEEIDDFLDDF